MYRWGFVHHCVVAPTKIYGLSLYLDMWSQTFDHSRNISYDTTCVLSTEVDTVTFHILPLQEAPMTHIRYPFHMYHAGYILHIHACT